MRRPLVHLLVCAALLLAACGDDDGTDADATTTTTSSTTSSTAPLDTTDDGDDAVTIGDFETVFTGLSIPWGVAFVDADTLLLTEREGQVLVVEGGAVRDEPARTVDVAAIGEGGLLGIALHPDFPDERSAYLYQTTGEGNRVSRFDVADDLTLSGEEVVLDGIPAAPTHDGGRIAFGPDGMLYVTTGDAGEPESAADVDSLAGKILRIAPDGSVPDDNPFEGSPVWSYGHRNPQGLAWDADGELFASEHGPTGEFGLCCNDEVNHIEPGEFYGWPFVAGNTETGAGTPPQEPVAPLATSGDDDTWAPTGMVVLDAGDERTLLVTTLAATSLLRFDLGAEIDEQVEPSTVTEDFGRLRLVTEGPDGCLWMATSNRDGRGAPTEDDDRLVRSCP